MSDMRLIVAGAGGRMGRALTRVIAETPGAVLAGALEAPGSELLGKDSGVLAGLPANGVKLSADLWALSEDADGILDFTVPAATIANVAIAAQRRLVHVIGTTGLSASDDAVIKSVTDRAVVVKSGNMSLGVNLLAALVKRVAQSLDDSFDIEILEMHHKAKIDAPSGTALMLGQAAAAGRGITLARACGARPRRPSPARAGPAISALRRLRGGTVGRRSQRDLCRRHGAHRAHAPRRGPHDVRAGRGQGRAVGAWQEARLLFDGRRARPWRLLKSRTRNGNHGNERTSSRARAPRPERMEPEEPVHRLEGSGSDRAGHGGSQGRRPQAEGAGPDVRRRLHLGAEARPAHARSDARGNRPDRICRVKKTSRSTSATMATSPASTRTMRARNGARSRC